MKRGHKLLLFALGVPALLMLGVGLLTRSYFRLEGRAPERSTGRQEVAEVVSSQFMVVSAHRLATEAGVEILSAGGSAIDAAVTIQMLLTLVEPQSSGIGGGAFLLYYDAGAKRLLAYDGREVAPRTAPSTLFLDADGEPEDFVGAVVGGRSVGVPGVLRALELAQKKHGKLAWANLFPPAIRAAEDGFRVGRRLHLLLRSDAYLPAMPDARAYFYPGDGTPVAPGHPLKNPALGSTFRLLSSGGADAFYEGTLADDIVSAVGSAERPSKLVAFLNETLIESGASRVTGWVADVPASGFLTREDLANYRAIEREPVCLPYRKWRLCGAPPPTSGGVAVLQIMGMLATQDVASLEPRSPALAHVLAEAQRLAFADRDVYIADPSFVKVPVERLLDPAYLQRRAKKIKGEKAMKKARPGRFKPVTAYEAGHAMDLPSTSHFVVIDREGNIASVTTSIENVFGSRLMVRGFLLNNQLTDFSFLPERNGKKVANALEPEKRPRSSMSPMIVFDESSGEPVLAIGSPGGSRIIGYVARALVGILDHGLSPNAAIALPHVINRNGATEIEDEGWGDAEEQMRTALMALGHQVLVGEQNSGIHAILRKDGRLYGGVDPRREGAAAGE